MSADEMQQMAEQCMETMQGMVGMMGGHGQAGAMPDGNAMGGGMGGMMGMGSMGSMMGIAGWFGLVVLGLLLAGVIALLAIVLTKKRRSEELAGAGPLDELDRRYARGDVDRDTYLQIRDDLHQARG